MPEISDLRREVEELALQVVMADSGDVAGGTPDQALAALDRISAIAGREGAEAEAAAAAAAAVRETLRAGGSVEESMARLQAAVNAPAVDAPALALDIARDPELLRDFVLESREHLAAIESQVLALERDPECAEALNAVFRGFHTIKGLAGFL